MKSVLRTAGVLAVGAMLLAACGSDTGTSGPGNGSHGGTNGNGGSSGIVTISNESGATWTCNFNPFNPSVSGESAGTVYEPLAFMDTLQSGAVTPWLATSYAWSNGNKTLTWTIRQGVKWSDGTPLTAADVAFTFNLMKKFPGIDLSSLWASHVLSSVTAVGNTVVMQFPQAAVPDFYYIADQTSIVPEHIWSTIKNPVTATVSKPVGSGPYEVSTCTAENIKYLANAGYWGGTPHIKEVDYPSYLSNNTANDDLASGADQWGAQFIPNIQSFYSSKSSDYHYWFPPTVNVDVFINLKNSVLSALPVREAMAYAINRSQVSSVGEYGYEPPANQTGIVTPTFSSWLDSSEASQYNGYAYNPGKAISILQGAGYKKNSSGVFVSPSGQALSFRILNIGGYSDWVASVQIIETELKAVGISITPDNLSSNSYDTDLYNGQYQLAYGEETGGPTPYFELRQWLLSSNSAPIGQQASTNWERYENAQTDSLINSYGATTDPGMQHQIVDQLEQVMLSDVPLIPITEGVDWYEYDTANLTGWPTQADPYAQPAAFNTPDIEVVLLHLRTK
ncbi:MAG TPA: ABC transporter substrate-binding protein [Acidimicrobiales bacterium]|nr:ABC transporter substrate-binding protein [Acidimicrobiales bacterium]